MKAWVATGVMSGALVLMLGALPAEVSAPPFFEPPRETLRVLFVGDIMLDRNVARTAKEEGPQALFAGVQELFDRKDVDLRVGNLEGTITTEPSIAQRNNKILRFTFAPELVEAVLPPLRFDALSLANNHALDFGEFGYDDTIFHLEKLGIKPFGSPYNDSFKLSTVLEHNGKTLCLIGYHSLFKSSTANVVEEIRRLRPDCWRVAVFAHWGEEYQTRSHAGQQEAAREFIDAGADAVIGAHPHVRQEVEEYKEAPIFYSLGNFMFDQNFSQETQRGNALILEFGPEGVEYTLIPTTIIDQKAALAGE